MDDTHFIIEVENSLSKLSQDKCSLKLFKKTFFTCVVKQITFTK